MSEYLATCINARIAKLEREAEEAAAALWGTASNGEPKINLYALKQIATINGRIAGMRWCLREFQRSTNQAMRELDEARGCAETLSVALSVETGRPAPRLPWQDER